MQKLVKRVVQAQNQVARRTKKRQRSEHAHYMKRRTHEETMTAESLANDIKNARKTRQENWNLGPIAPTRDLGDDNYGTFSRGLRTNRQAQLLPQEVEKRCAWAGGSKYLSIMPKDRVVVLEGPHKGQIDKISKINMDFGTLELENLSKVCNEGEHYLDKMQMKFPINPPIFFY
jgi:large subunit ribosomal protein L24